MKKNRLTVGGLLRFFRPRENVQEKVGRLQPEVNFAELPGPFDYALGIGSYSVEDFHKRTDMGKLLRLMKQSNSKAAADRLKSFIIPILEEKKLPHQPDLMVTIPDSVPDRRFRSVAYLSDKIADHFGWGARHDIIDLVRQEKPQKERSFRERLADTQPRYTLRYPDVIKGRHVLLFDDIYATGKSLIEAAELIRKNSPASVMAITLVKLNH
jgi:predicted amidophosphoribosyltransferase